MTALLFLLWSSVAWANPITVTLCFEFQIDFTDAQYGDFWDTNDNRLARGVRYEIIDAVQTLTGWASPSTGCAVETLTLTSTDQTFIARAKSRALVGGIELSSHPSDAWESKPIRGLQWNLDAAPQQSFTLALGNTQVWHNLAVGTWIMNRNTLNVDQDPGRDCCLEPEPMDTGEYNYDGTCGPSAPASNEYARIATPIHMFADPDPDNPAETGTRFDLGCGGSNMVDASGDPHPALAVGNCALKFTLAHELGHVIVMMRMGGRSQDPARAPLDNCMANYWDTGMTEPVDFALSDTGPFGVRSMMSKEYMGKAFREGWADFVAIWLWNRRTESDCVIAGISFGDFDLDGDIDNAQERLIDCIGTPHVDTAEPASPVMDNVNWLDDLEQYADAAGCVRDTDDTREANRSTIYDVSKMFWKHVTTTLGPSQASDLYVDMCPRGWAGTDTFTDTDELPLERLKISGASNGIQSDVLHKINYVDH